MNGFVQTLARSPTCKRRDKKKDDITRYMYIDTITSPGEKDGCSLHVPPILKVTPMYH